VKYDSAQMGVIFSDCGIVKSSLEKRWENSSLLVACIGSSFPFRKFPSMSSNGFFNHPQLGNLICPLVVVVLLVVIALSTFATFTPRYAGWDFRQLV
jgi:hypothetical protein